MGTLHGHSLLALMPGCVVTSSARSRPAVDRDAAHESTRTVIDRFVDLLYGRRQVRAAFESCVTRLGYVDHSPGGFGSRAEAMRGLAPKLGPGGAQVDVLHVVADRDMAMVHLRHRPAGQAHDEHRVEIFRVALGRIVEHWGVS